MNAAEVRKALTSIEKLPQIFEPHHVETFRAHRENKEGERVPIKIEIWDNGIPQSRWRVIVEDDQGHRLVGSHWQYLHEALGWVPWQELDR